MPNDKGAPLAHPNKTVGVQNNKSKNSGLQTPKREQVRVHSVKPKCLQKVRDILNSDKCEYMAEFEDEVQSVAESTPIDSRDKPLKQRYYAM
jgi:hypothetical protein